MWNIVVILIFLVLIAIALVSLQRSSGTRLLKRIDNAIEQFFQNHAKVGASGLNISRDQVNLPNVINGSPDNVGQLQVANTHVCCIRLNAGKNNCQHLEHLRPTIQAHKPAIWSDNTETMNYLKNQFGYQQFKPLDGGQFVAY